MPLNIKNPEVERLVTELAVETGESKTEVVRRALQERRARLAHGRRVADLKSIRNFLEREIWNQVPRSLQGRRLSKRKAEKILGYGRDGV
ncbi:MAG: type II toxin-antitoxin system VapB family antitoxin [Thermoanaerobaculia bacterium]